MTKDEAKNICECLKNGKKQQGCRQFIKYKKDHNCVLCAVEEHGEMSSREVADRIGLSHVRVLQIEKEALAKIFKIIGD